MNTLEITENINNNKIDWYEYLYFFMIVVYAGMASPFTKNMIHYSGQPIGFIIPIIMTIILLIKNPVYFYDTSFLIIIIIVTVWQIAQFLKTSYFNVSYAFFIYYAIFIAYILIKVFQFKIFFLYERIVTQLSVVAIVGWVLMIIAPGIMGQLIDTIKLPQSGEGIIRGNIIIFSMTSNFYEGQEAYGLIRNSGFSWEPGRYATMVIIALFFNMARTRFQFKRNISFWILLVALVTTQSTTGYVTFSILILFFMINQKNVNSILYLILIIPLIVTMYQLPFVGEKINTLLDVKTQRSNTYNYIRTNQTKTYVPQRFNGLAYEFLNISNDPILGYGLDSENSYVSKNISKMIALANGLFKVFARFGIIMGALFYFFLYKSSKYIVSLYNLKGGIIYMLVFLSISISYDFTLVPFFLSSAMFYLFSDKEIISNSKWVYSKARIIFDGI